MMRLGWREVGQHVVALAWFGLLSVGLTWPLARDFNSLLIGNGSPDIHESVWIQWHYKEALRGRQPLLTTQYVYYPDGVPMLLAGDGPLVPLLGLPFWRWGAVAAYNGGMLVGVWLTGYCTYLLGRGLGCPPSVAGVMGVMGQVAPMALGGLQEHNQTTFIGFLPLALLAAHRGLDLKRGRGWTLGVGLVLLAVSLYSGYQLVYAGLGVGLLFLMRWATTPREARLGLLKRAGLVAVWSLALVGPYLALVLTTAADPRFDTNVNVAPMSRGYAPDIAQFFLPSFFHALLGPLLWQPNPDPHAYPLTRLPWLNPTADWVGVNIETAVTLPWTGLALAAIALFVARDRRARAWLAFTLVFIVLALGPLLRAFGHTTFTAVKLPIILPFAFFVSLPGLDFMRVSSRMMMMGAVGLAVLAGLGLTWLQGRYPHWRLGLAGLAVGLVLLESWPRPWPQVSLPAASPFYQFISADTDTYGILDLPLGFTYEPVTGYWIRYAGIYQMYQLVHHKPIAWGYLSHGYSRHPVPVIQRMVEYGTVRNPPLLINGQPASPFANAMTDLAKAGYRYIILHKTVSGQNQTAKEDQTARALLDAILGPTTTPVWEDRLVQVYQLPPPDAPRPLQPALKTLGAWRYGPGEEYYTASPARLQIDLPKSETARLALTPLVIHEPTAWQGVGARGILDVTVDDVLVASVPIERGQEVSIPLTLRAGTQVVGLSLRAGNFRSVDFGGQDTTVLSYSVQSIDLRLGP